MLNSFHPCVAVLSNIKAVAEVVRRVSPDTLVILSRDFLLEAYSSWWNNRLSSMLSALQRAKKFKWMHGALMS